MSELKKFGLAILIVLFIPLACWFLGFCVLKYVEINNKKIQAWIDQNRNNILKRCEAIRATREEFIANKILSDKDKNLYIDTNRFTSLKAELIQDWSFFDVMCNGDIESHQWILTYGTEIAGKVFVSPAVGGVQISDIQWMPKPKPSNTLPPDECSSKNYQWLTFNYNNVEKVLDDKQTYFVKKSWYQEAIYDKEAMVEHAGKCVLSGFNFVTFKDKYSGEEVAVYRPLLGAKVYK